MRHAADVDLAASFQEHGAPALQQPFHQRVHVFLQQRLAAGHLDKRAAICVDLLQHRVDRHLLTFGERVRRIAPRTAQIAAGQPHKDARFSGVCRLALNRIENLVDRQHASLFYRFPAGAPGLARIKL